MYRLFHMALQPVGSLLVDEKQELIRSWDSERELFYDDIIHVEASAYAHWTDLLTSTTHIYTLCPRKNGPLSMFKNLQKLGSFVQLQFNCINICLFSIKLPNFVKICPTVIEILTFNKWSLQLTVSRSVLSYLRPMEHWRKCHISKTKTNKMVFNTEDLVLVKVLRQEKGYHNWWMITLLQWR